MGSLPPMQQGVAAQQPLAPMNLAQQPSAAAGGGGKGGKTAIKVALGVGGVAVLGSIVWLVISLLAGGGDTHDKIADDMIRGMKEMSELIVGIDTPEDAKNALGDLERLDEEMRAIVERGRVIEKPDEETQQRLKAKVNEVESSAGAAVFAKMMTWEDPGIGEHLQGWMERQMKSPPEPIDWLKDDGGPGVEIDLSDPNAAAEPAKNAADNQDRSAAWKAAAKAAEERAEATRKASIY